MKTALLAAIAMLAAAVASGEERSFTAVARIRAEETIETDGPDDVTYIEWRLTVLYGDDPFDSGTEIGYQCLVFGDEPEYLGEDVLCRVMTQWGDVISNVDFLLDDLGFVLSRGTGELSGIAGYCDYSFRPFTVVRCEWSVDESASGRQR